MRSLTTQTRIKIEKTISRLFNGEKITLKERIELHKYASKIPFIGLKLDNALISRNSLYDTDN